MAEISKSSTSKLFGNFASFDKSEDRYQFTYTAVLMSMTTIALNKDFLITTFSSMLAPFTQRLKLWRVPRFAEKRRVGVVPPVSFRRMCIQRLPPMSVAVTTPVLGHVDEPMLTPRTVWSCIRLNHVFPGTLSPLSEFLSGGRNSCVETKGIQNAYEIHIIGKYCRACGKPCDGICSKHAA